MDIVKHKLDLPDETKHHTDIKCQNNLCISIFRDTQPPGPTSMTLAEVVDTLISDSTAGMTDIRLAAMMLNVPLQIINGDYGIVSPPIYYGATDTIENIVGLYDVFLKSVLPDLLRYDDWTRLMKLCL
jgi:hypothetical protein